MTIPKRLKCASPYLPEECLKPHNIDAKCANFGGRHPATYKEAREDPELADDQLSSLRKEGVSFADTAR